MKAHADELLAQATRLLGATTSQDVLLLTCREVQRIAGVERLFGSLATSSAWASGIHQRFHREECAAIGPRERSALFAVHRAVARQRGPVRLARPAAATVVDALCGRDGRHGSVLAVPILHPRGRLNGCLALCVEGPWPAAIEAFATEIGGLAALAFENVQRILSARRDRERLNLLAEAAEEALWDWEPATGEFWWGGGVQTLIGDVVVQSRLSWKFEQIHADEQERIRRSFERAVSDPAAETWHEEYRQRRTDGSWIRVEDRAHILRDSAGRAHRVVGSLRDVTELRALLAREHAARAEAERANLAKDEFLAMLGHELRNPLSPILSSLHILRRHSDPEMLDKGLTIIERQARHLTRLVDDLLDVARIAQGKVLLRRDRVDLAEVIEVALERANPLIEERHHAVDARLARDLGVEADRARMEQVIANLLNNAAKYTPPGGRITVEARRVDDMVEVGIADSGIGISAEMLPQVFETFVQDRQSIDRSRGGLGLGLAIVRNLVQLHGGTVAAHSDGEGQGSQFVVRIPAADVSPVRASVATAEPATRHASRRVLIVDDNQDAAELLAVGLVERGHQTRVVHDGQTALVAVQDFDPDVVLLDLGLPAMDGYEVARRLRARLGAGRPRLVAVTGYGQEVDRRRTLDCGFNLHLVKPVDFERVHEAVVGA